MVLRVVHVLAQKVHMWKLRSLLGYLTGLVPIAAFSPEVRVLKSCARSNLHFSHLMTSLVRVPVMLQGSYLGKASDVALGIAIPVHSHIAINSVLSDYVPKSVRGRSPSTIFETLSAQTAAKRLHCQIANGSAYKSIMSGEKFLASLLQVWPGLVLSPQLASCCLDS